MYDTYVVLQGWVGTDPETHTAGTATVTKFRVGCTPRYRKKNDEYHDGETTWYDVKAWRTLGENVARSVRKGDPVVVRGRLQADQWQRDDGVRSTTLVVEAGFVGHDLNRGTAAFIRTPRKEYADADAGPATAQAAHGDPWASAPTAEPESVEGPAASVA